MTGLLEAAMPHLVVVPILLPMFAAAVMLLLGEGRRRIKFGIGLVSTLTGLGVALALARQVELHGVLGYLPGNWPAHVGIALAIDRLSSLMLVLTWTLGAAALTFSMARWHRAGVYFHALLQLQLMGLSGAFLTADVFNLFVFFEIMLAASYGLLLHGSGRHRVRASVHYVVVNLIASSLFLIGAAVIYGVTGTLNMAALSVRLSEAALVNRPLVDAGAAILAVAFLIKAAAWPLNLWLSGAYSSATPPVAAVFAILTKVGIYALLRLWTLMFSGGPLEGFGANALLVFGIITAGLAAVGVVASHRLSQQASWAVVVSAGTALAALGVGDPRVLSAAVFYLAGSTLAASTLFLLVDLVDRWRAGATPVDDAPFLSAALEHEDVNLDDEEEPLVALPFPASTALLALAYVACAVVLAGLPPLSGFIGKVGMLSAALALRTVDGAVPPRAWALLALLLGTGLLTLIGFSRSGIRTFWSGTAREAPRVRVAEGLPVLALLCACVLLTVAAGPALEFAAATTHSLYERAPYVGGVLGTQVKPSPGAGEVGP